MMLDESENNRIGMPQGRAMTATTIGHNGGGPLHANDLAARAQGARPDRVRSIPETADIVGVSPGHLRRLIARGEGPRIIRLSARKNGVRDSDREAWLTACAAWPDKQ